MCRRWIGVVVLSAVLLIVAPTVVVDPPALLGDGSRYMHDPPPGATLDRPFRLDDPGRYVLIVYLNGSTVEPEPDACDTSRPGINIPLTATDLAGETIDGYEILVFAFCTPARVGGFNQPDGDGEPKVEKRAQDLDALLAFAADQGFPPSHIFLMGQSAGAWASLLTLRRSGITRAAGMVGFAPAFAGFHGRRKPIWQEERDRQAAFIGQAGRLDALIFGFVGDPFEPPEAMGWLRDMPGVEYRTLSGRTIAGVHCDNKYPHSTVFKDCFRHSQRSVVLNFLRSRLATPNG